MRTTRAAALVAALALAAAPLRAQPGCVPRAIECGQTVGSFLTADACQDATGHFYDTYFFTGYNQQIVTANLSSNAFDAFLRLQNPVLEFVAGDDDSGPGFDARIVHTLEELSSDWALVATTVAPGATGAYTLKLDCQGGQSPPRPGLGWFDDPRYPDFSFYVEIGDVQGEREPECLRDTVCVSGALPDRPEVFLRIIGPRGNGFLWPILVRFTRQRVYLSIFQHSSQRTKNYELAALAPEDDALPGLQDRTAFLP